MSKIGKKLIRQAAFICILGLFFSILVCAAVLFPALKDNMATDSQNITSQITTRVDNTLSNIRSFGLELSDIILPEIFEDYDSKSKDAAYQAEIKLKLNNYIAPFNNIYGIINYIIVDVLHLAKEVPLWFDQPASAFILVTIFAIWKFFPYAYMSFVAILQSIDKSLYEAADMDGANSWQKFMTVTYPAIKPTLVTVVSLRTIWVFYIYTEVYLLTKQVDVLGVYLYDMAFATHDFGKAAAISIILFVVIFSLVMLIRKKVLRVEEDE